MVWVYDPACPACEAALPAIRTLAMHLDEESRVGIAGGTTLFLQSLSPKSGIEEVVHSGLARGEAARVAALIRNNPHPPTPFALVYNGSHTAGVIGGPAARDSASLMVRARELANGDIANDGPTRRSS